MALGDRVILGRQDTPLPGPLMGVSLTHACGLGGGARLCLTAILVPGSGREVRSRDRVGWAPGWEASGGEGGVEASWGSGKVLKPADWKASSGVRCRVRIRG